jgi:hypothetical protein
MVEGSCSLVVIRHYFSFLSPLLLMALVAAPEGLSYRTLYIGPFSGIILDSLTETTDLIHYLRCRTRLLSDDLAISIRLAAFPLILVRKLTLLQCSCDSQVISSAQFITSSPNLRARVGSLQTSGLGSSWQIQAGRFFFLLCIPLGYQNPRSLGVASTCIRRERVEVAK